MGIKHQKKMKSGSEEKRNILPVEEWAEDISHYKNVTFLSYLPIFYGTQLLWGQLQLDNKLCRDCA
jgi:hypothetical protein